MIITVAENFIYKGRRYRAGESWTLEDAPYDLQVYVRTIQGIYSHKRANCYCCCDDEGTIEPLEDKKDAISDDEWIERAHGEEDH